MSGRSRQDEPVQGHSLRGPVMAGTAGKAAEAGTLVALAVVLPRLLGPADYGGFSVALTVVTIGSVALTMGGATLLARFVPTVPPARRPGVALALTRRLARNRAVVLGGLAVAGAAAVLLDPARFPPVPTACVLAALALNVGATLALQAGLGLGRTLAWSIRYPVQNAVLITAAAALHGPAGLTGTVVAVLLAALAAALLGGSALVPMLRQRHPAVPVPDGALRFGLLQATGGVLTQLTQRGGVLAVALSAGPAEQTGFAALAIGIALAATYAVVQIFTVTLPVLTSRAGAAGPRRAEAVLRRIAGLVLALVVPTGVLVVAGLATVVPAVFGAGFAGAAGAFGPAIAMVVLAPVNALAVQAAALRMRPQATVHAALAGAVVFVVAAIAAVPAWGAVGATTAAAAGTAATAVASILLLPRAVGARLTAATFGGAAVLVAAFLAVARW